MAVAVIQARMGSTRLPGKVLRPLGPRSTLSWVLRAAAESEAFATIVVATTTEPDDDAIADAVAADPVDAQVVRGPVDDVLARYCMAVDEHPDDTVVRLTADCPLLDPSVIAAAVAAFEADDVDYLSTIDPRTLPRGLDVEVLSANALREADRDATGTDRVHVTPFVREHPDRFRSASLTFEPPADDLRVTLDTAEDAALLDAVVAELGDRPPPWRDVVALLRARPDLVTLNAGVRQKSPDEG